MVRSSESADSFPAGVETVLGDLADRASLDAALEGADKLFLLCGPTQDEVEFNQNAIVRPNMFMENVPENYVASIDETGNFYANARPVSVWSTRATWRRSRRRC